MRYRPTDEEEAAIPEELRVMMEDLSMIMRQWDKGRGFAKELGISGCHEILAYLDSNTDIEWVRCATYEALADFHDENPLKKVADEYNAWCHAEDAKPAWRKLLRGVLPF